MKAKAYGRIKEQASAHEAMGTAERAAERIGEREEPPETGYVQPGLVDTQLAEALLSLGDLSAANAWSCPAEWCSGSCGEFAGHSGGLRAVHSGGE
jgi:hypothetical protein